MAQYFFYAIFYVPTDKRPRLRYLDSVDVIDDRYCCADKRSAMTSPDLAAVSSLVVVSNRLPFSLVRCPATGALTRKPAAGGLVTAVAPVVIQSKARPHFCL